MNLLVLCYHRIGESIREFLPVGRGVGDASPLLHVREESEFRENGRLGGVLDHIEPPPADSSIFRASCPEDSAVDGGSKGRAFARVIVSLDPVRAFPFAGVEMDGKENGIAEPICYGATLTQTDKSIVTACHLRREPRTSQACLNTFGDVESIDLLGVFLSGDSTAVMSAMTGIDDNRGTGGCDWCSAGQYNQDENDQQAEFLHEGGESAKKCAEPQRGVKGLRVVFLRNFLVEKVRYASSVRDVEICT